MLAITLYQHWAADNEDRQLRIHAWNELQLESDLGLVIIIDFNFLLLEFSLYSGSNLPSSCWVATLPPRKSRRLTAILYVAAEFPEPRG